MVGELLKELFHSLGRYTRYRLARIFAPAGPQTPQIPQTPPMEMGIAKPEQIAHLSDAIGLDPSYLEGVLWRADRADESNLGLAANPVYQLWRAIPQGHKWTHYFGTYETLFGPRRSGPMRILEIGVFRGSSLQLWRKYFHHPETIVVGVDIDPGCARFDAPAEGKHVRIGSQADPEFLKRVVEEFGPFDLIIDDGSHHSSHMIASFNILYRDGLKDDGIYLAEDLHANYWFPWRDSRRAFLDLCKELAELMQAHYAQAWLEDWNREYAGAPLQVMVPKITLMIKEVRVFDSIVAIYKANRQHLPRTLVH